MGKGDNYIWEGFIIECLLAETLDSLGLCRYYTYEPRNGHESPGQVMDNGGYFDEAYYEWAVRRRNKRREDKSANQE